MDSTHARSVRGSGGAGPASGGTSGPVDDAALDPDDPDPAGGDELQAVTKSDNARTFTMWRESKWKFIPRVYHQSTRGGASFTARSYSAFRSAGVSTFGGETGAFVCASKKGDGLCRPRSAFLSKNPTLDTRSPTGAVGCA